MLLSKPTFKEGQHRKAHRRLEIHDVGEAGLMSVFAVSAYVCFFAGAMGHDPSFTFCALLAFAASLAAAIILNRHYERPCDYRRRRHLGPTKFGLLMAIWPLDDKEMQSHARRIASTPSIQR
ncbi:hypothetical protein XH94_23515 [Bradyrhizobium zhanjiangense]|uniref:Uncharacterized protein n=1 Tax=Bradyrhizobium zhanjiangense TaxID=1325107 RepID=A0A4Q0SIC6_9BRAD|nr:hypothetical protein XH94_23515 [Bradyrhizobium zhanjiangense]